MNSRFRCLTVCLSALGCVWLVILDPALAAEEPAEFIKVKSGEEYKLATPPIAELEAGKTLEVQVRGTLQDGIVAIGGETTGTNVKIGAVTWEIDLSADPKLKAAAKELSGKQVLVTGKVQKRPGVEIKFRTILSAATLQGVKK